MVEAGIQQQVADNAGVQALLGAPARFYPVIEPENPTWPVATYRVISDLPQYTLRAGGPAALSTMRLQVDCKSGGTGNASYSSAKAVQAAIRAALEFFRGALPDGTFVEEILVATEHDGYGQDGRTYICSTDYRITYHPA